MMDKYYQMEGDEGKKFYDEEGNFNWEAESSSSSSDDSEPQTKKVKKNPQGDEASDQAEEGEADISGFLEDEDSEENFSEAADVPLGETVDENLGSRLALNKMDWDTISATDLYALFSGLCSGDKFVKKVEIYPSLFGIEKMKEDAINGPPKEIFDPGHKVTQKKHKKVDSSDDEEDLALAAGFQKVDDNLDAFNQAKLRKYELQKMKYYYAIVYCNSPATAKFLYDEYNGFEFENSNILLNMSFVPDDL